MVQDRMTRGTCRISAVWLVSEFVKRTRVKKKAREVRFWTFYVIYEQQNQWHCYIYAEICFNRHTKGNAFSNLIYIYFLLILASKCSDIGFVNIAGERVENSIFFYFIVRFDEMSENAI